MKLNKALKVLFVSNSVFVFASALLGPLYAVFVEQISGKIFWVSVSWATYVLAATLSVSLVARIADGRKNKWVFLAIGFLLRSAVWLGYAFTNSIWMLLVLQVLMGIGESFGTTSFEVMVAKHLDHSKEMTEYADWHVMSNIVVVVGTLVGGWVVTEYGFKPLFFMISALAAISFVILFFSPKQELSSE